MGQPNSWCCLLAELVLLALPKETIGQQGNCVLVRARVANEGEQSFWCTGWERKLPSPVGQGERK